MGKQNFQNGIRKYLKDNEYTTAVTKNLWDSLASSFPTVIITNLI